MERSQAFVGLGPFESKALLAAQPVLSEVPLMLLIMGDGLRITWLYLITIGPNSLTRPGGVLRRILPPPIPPRPYIAADIRAI